MLNLKNVNKLTVNSKKVKVNTLTNIFLEIKQGDFVCIQGVNGSGKSALLSIIGADDLSFSGEYFIDGIELSKYTSKQLQALKCSRFGVVPEVVDLLEKRTIEQNIELALRVSRMPKPDRKNAIVKAVNSVGLSERILSLKPTDLSVGQCQRVMIARAIASNPQVIIADNPTALMDEESSELILNLFTALNKGGVTIIAVTRDENFLKRAKRVFTMSRGMLVENMKITRGKNVGEVIDIDAKKKKTQKTSIKKQVIVPEKKVETKKEESVDEAKLNNLEKANEEQVVPVDETSKKEEGKEANLPKKETKTKVAERKKSTKKTITASPPKKKKDNDNNQLTIEELVGAVKKDDGGDVKSPKKTATAKKAKEETKKDVKEAKIEEDSELLIKPVKSSKRKTK